VVVDTPDVRGREAILAVHVRDIPLDDDVSLSVLARGTPGFTGADLANMVNEAALLAARENADRVRMEDFERAKDKVLMGAERRSLILSDDEKRTTAVHEAGHALVAYYTPNSDPIHKVSIIPRGRALGVTQLLPVDDRHNYSREYLHNLVAHSLGGRAAEEVVFGSISTGAANDLKRATELARRMVCEWGMSERLGPIAFADKDDQVFLGKEIAHLKNYSEKTAQQIDEEIQAIIMGNYRRARKLLEQHRHGLDKLAGALLEREVLDIEAIREILGGGADEGSTVS